jgi:hypothetical protein
VRLVWQCPHTYHSDTRFVEEDDKTNLPGMAWHGRSASFLSFFKPAITPPSTTPQQLISPSWWVSDLFLTSTYLVFALLFSLFQESMICESLNSSGGLEGGPKYVMYLSLGIENHPRANFLLFSRRCGRDCF